MGIFYSVKSVLNTSKNRKKKELIQEESDNYRSLVRYIAAANGTYINSHPFSLAQLRLLFR